MTPGPGQSAAMAGPADTGTAGDASSGLEWACRLLWGANDSVQARRAGAPPAGFRPVEAYLPLPRASNPRVLVPLGSPRAASAALARNHDATSRKSRVVKAALAAGLRAGVAQRLLPDRIDVFVAAGLAGDDLRSALLTEHLRAVFGRRDLVMAVILGTPRLNRKPVLQILSEAGDVLGYVKAAWNDLTRNLVRNEASVLRHLASDRRNSFAAPDVIHHGAWPGGPGGSPDVARLELLAASPLPHTVKPQEAQVFEPPLPVITEIARLWGTSQGPLAESAYWAGVRERLAARPESGPLPAIVDHVEARYGAVSLRFGAWHGDFTPWNMARLDNGIFVWDWERAAPAPVGLDLFHFMFQSVCRFEGRNPERAVEICRKRSPGLLPLLDVPLRSEEALWSLYRMELLFRYDEARLAGVLERPSRIHAGILEMFATDMEAC